MKLGLIEIETAYLGNIQLNSSNAFIGTTPLIDSSTLPEPALDYFYLQPLQSGNYTVDANDETWLLKNTFEFSKDKQNWRKFSSLQNHTTTTTQDLSTFMANNTDYCVLALDIAVYNSDIVSQGYTVNCYESKTATGTSSNGKVATLITTDETYAYFYCQLNSTPTSGVTCRWFIQDGDMYRNRSGSRSISQGTPYMVHWNGRITTSSGITVVDPADYDVEITITQLFIDETIPLAANDKLYLRNTGGIDRSSSTSKAVQIIKNVQDSSYNVGGILPTIYDYTAESFDTISTSYYGNSFFRGITTLIDASMLKLPATTLANYCYSSMFYGCSSLASIPELPATTLASSCYNLMFYNCSSLTTAPELPATTLASSCYKSMFNNCTSLTSAPELPATTLASGCYSYMFLNCTSLSYIKCLGTNAIQAAASTGWLLNVAASGTFEGDSSLIADWSYGYNGVPDGWTEVGINRNLFRLECESGSATIGIQQMSSNYTGEYSIDNGVSWTPLSTSILIPLSQGESVAFRGKLTANNSESNYTYFKKTNDNSSKINAKGMLFYFLKKDGYNNNSTNYKYEATLLFSGSNGVNIDIVDASDLILFNNVAQYGYFRMFYYCTSLTTAPELPATTLAIDCYSFMFLYCSSLTSAPVLPATTLVSGCYKYMFNPCNSLNKVITYANDISANLALYEWIGGGVSTTGDFYNLGGANYPSGTSGIPSGWTEHTSL